MLVKDLIKELEKYNPDAKVSLLSSDIVISYVSTDGLTKEDTSQVFLEVYDYCFMCEFNDEGYCIVYDKCANDVTECYQFQEISDE